MSRDAEGIRQLKKKAMELKLEFEGEIDRIIKDIDGKVDAQNGEMYRLEDDDENLDEYEARLEGLKDELKKLKKIKKQQKKISKLEEEKVDVIKEIEEKRNIGKKSKGHKKH